MSDNKFKDKDINTENDSSQDSGIELLHLVIESNKAVEISGKAIFHMYCDIKEDMKKIHILAQEENLKRETLFKSIPDKIIAEISPESVLQLEKFNRKTKIVKYLVFGSLAILLISFFVLTATIYLGKNWYRESIRTKTEVREEILKETKNENKAIYETEQIKQLEHNTTLMKKWMKKNPKDAEKFLKFKEGYESR
jgi:mannitol-specific phosphotransferase system IIBC component